MLKILEAKIIIDSTSNYTNHLIHFDKLKRSRLHTLLKYFTPHVRKEPTATFEEISGRLRPEWIKSNLIHRMLGDNAHDNHHIESVV